MAESADYSITALGYCVLMIASWVLGYFSFSIFWTWLLMVFIVLTARLWRKRQKRIQALQYAATREKEAVTAYLKELPEWVQFGDEEKVEWINKLIAQLWPFVTQFALAFFKETLEPAIRSSLPSMLGRFTIEELRVGQMPVRVEAVKVFKNDAAKLERNVITMDMEIGYDSDFELVISVNFAQAGARRMKVKGKVRVIFGPMIPKPPFIEAVSVFFLTQPLIDFDLTGLGEILEIPALLKTLKNVINNQIANLCVLPNQIVVPLSADADVSRLNMPELDGAIRVHILEARNLENRDRGLGGRSDGYVKVSVGAQTYRTKTIDNDLNPVWEEMFEAVVYHVSVQQLRAEVYDEDPGSDEFLGEIAIDLSCIKGAGFMDQWYPLEHAESGEMHLRIVWFDLTAVSPIIPTVGSDTLLADEGSMEPAAEDSLDANGDGTSTAVLMAYVEKAFLPGKTPRSKQLAFIQLSIGESKVKSKTRPQGPTENPVYQEKFYFFVARMQEAILKVEAKDSNANGRSLGYTEIPVSRLLREPTLELHRAEFPLSEAEGSEQQPLVVLTLRLRYLRSTTTDRTEERSSALRKRRKNTMLTGSRDGTETILGSQSSLSIRGALSTTSAHHRKVSKRPKKLSSAAMLPPNWGKLEASICYNDRWSALAITVHRICGLVPFSDEYTADPFLVVSVIKNMKAKKSKSATKKNSLVQHNTLNPSFDETFEFKIPKNELRDHVLTMKAKDAIKYSSKLVLGKQQQTLGAISVDLSKFDPDRPLVKKWFDLEPPDE